MAVGEVSRERRRVEPDRVDGEAKQQPATRETTKAALAPAAVAAAPSKVALKLLSDGASVPSAALKPASLPVAAPSLAAPSVKISPSKAVETLRALISTEPVWPSRRGSPSLVSGSDKLVLRLAVESYSLREVYGKPATIIVNAARKDISDARIKEAVQSVAGKDVAVIVYRPREIAAVARKALAPYFDADIKMTTSAEGEPVIDMSAMPFTEHGWNDPTPTQFHTKHGDMPLQQLQEIVNAAMAKAGLEPAWMTYADKGGVLE